MDRIGCSRGYVYLSPPYRTFISAGGCIELRQPLPGQIVRCRTNAVGVLFEQIIEMLTFLSQPRGRWGRRADGVCAPTLVIGDGAGAGGDGEQIPGFEVAIVALLVIVEGVRILPDLVELTVPTDDSRIAMFEEIHYRDAPELEPTDIDIRMSSGLHRCRNRTW